MKCVFVGSLKEDSGYIVEVLQEKEYEIIQAGEYDQIEKLIEVYFANMEKFISATNEGNLSMPPDELTIKQKEAGVEQILSLYGKAKKLMVGP